MHPELVVIEGQIAAVRLAGQEYSCDPDSIEAFIPKGALTGFKLSTIPDELTIKPVESVTGQRIEIRNDIGLSRFAQGSASAVVEIMQRRKHWDGRVGLSPYIEAYREAIRERVSVKESSFEDDGDYVFLKYEITINEDHEIQDAIRIVDSIIAAIDERTEQITRRRLDALTNIFDRGTFDADLAQGLESAKTDPISLIVIDLDKFKQINDAYGHEAGDEVLVKIANVLRVASDGRGHCYRYGGDEMTVVLPKHNVRQASDIAERIRACIAELTFERCPENITASIGLSSYPEITPVSDDLFADADAMAYQAKEDGGNAVRGAMTSENRTDSARTIRIEISSRVEAVELWMRLQEGTQQHFSALITNDSDEDVTLEAITLKKDKLYLSEPAKPNSPDDWTIKKHSRQSVTWKSPGVPVQKLRHKDTFQVRMVEIDIVAWGRVLGRRKKFSHTVLTLVNYDTQSFTEIM
jgi:diguanylate cyclase (GGDEF)-like protein